MSRDTILVIDDDAAVRRVVRRQLVTAWPEYRVVEAADGAAGLALVGRHVALIVCDVNMPRLGGFDVCRALREAPPQSGVTDVPVILLTGRDQEADLLQGWDCGSTLHVAKPFARERFIAAVATILGEAEVQVA
jgi:CheY-like chemotaxis protein